VPSPSLFRPARTTSANAERNEENAMKTKSQIKAGAESVALPPRKNYIR
jgi:hypothetical protein